MMNMKKTKYIKLYEDYNSSDIKELMINLLSLGENDGDYQQPILRLLSIADRFNLDDSDIKSVLENVDIKYYSNLVGVFNGILWKLVGEFVRKYITENFSTTNNDIILIVSNHIVNSITKTDSYDIFFAYVDYSLGKAIELKNYDDLKKLHKIILYKIEDLIEWSPDDEYEED